MRKDPVLTDKWCVEAPPRGRRRHHLRVKRDDLRKVWADMDEIERKNLKSLVPAYCPSPSCPEHQRPTFVGTDLIPGVRKLVDA